MPYCDEGIVARFVLSFPLLLSVIPLPRRLLPHASHMTVDCSLHGKVERELWHWIISSVINLAAEEGILSPIVGAVLNVHFVRKQSEQCV